MTIVREYIRIGVLSVLTISFIRLDTVQIRKETWPMEKNHRHISIFHRSTSSKRINLCSFALWLKKANSKKNIPVILPVAAGLIPHKGTISHGGHRVTTLGLPTISLPVGYGRYIHHSSGQL